MTMPRYKLRTLLIVLALGPLPIAVGWCKYLEWSASARRNAALPRGEPFVLWTACHAA